jgi:hypothetical protein
MRNYSQCTISILQTTNSEKNLDWIVSENAGATRILRSTLLYSLWNTLYRYVTLIHFYQITDENISKVQFKIQLKIYSEISIHNFWSDFRKMQPHKSINPLPLLFKSLLPAQEDCVFFSGHLNLHAKPETRIPYREKNYNH